MRFKFTQAPHGIPQLQSCRKARHKPLLLSFWWSVLEGIKHIVLQKLLIGNPHLHRLSSRTVLTVPGEQKYIVTYNEVTVNLIQRMLSKKNTSCIEETLTSS